MRTVNSFFVDRLLGPLWGLADDDEAVAAYRAFDPNNEAKVRELIRSELKPYFVRWNPGAQQIARDSLRYWLSFRPHELEGIFDSMLPPFPSPDPPELLFVLLWEELFGPEDYHLDDPSEFVVRNDAM
ncbi:MAG: hypothetical protein ACRDIF_00250, partial [Actinomycetota bacterium]